MDTNYIYQYTLQDAINDGIISEIKEAAPEKYRLFTTEGVLGMKGKGFNTTDDDYLFFSTLCGIWEINFLEMPTIDTTGKDDQDFFVFHYRGVKLFSVRNELGFTIMLPEEY